MFDLIGITLAIYTLIAAATGSVWTKSGVGTRLVSRENSPEYFWIVIAIYAGLSLAMIIFF